MKTRQLTRQDRRSNLRINLTAGNRRRIQRRTASATATGMVPTGVSLIWSPRERGGGAGGGASPRTGMVTRTGVVLSICVRPR